MFYTKSNIILVAANYVVELVAGKERVLLVQLLLKTVVQAHEQRVHGSQAGLLVGAHVSCKVGFIVDRVISDTVNVGS